VKFHYGFLKFFCIVILLDAIDFVVLSDDALVGSEGSTQHVSCHWATDILITTAVWVRGHNSYCNVREGFCLPLTLLLIILLIIVISFIQDCLSDDLAPYHAYVESNQTPTTCQYPISNTPHNPVKHL